MSRLFSPDINLGIHLRMWKSNTNFFFCSYKKNMLLTRLCFSHDRSGTREPWKPKQLAETKAFQTTSSQRCGDQNTGPWCTFHPDAQSKYFMARKFKALELKKFVNSQPRPETQFRFILLAIYTFRELYVLEFEYVFISIIRCQFLLFLVEISGFNDRIAKQASNSSCIYCDLSQRITV